MDALTEIISVSQKWEQRLERDYRANGRGLHEKISSIEVKLPKKATPNLRVVATIRNRAKTESPAFAKKELKNIRRLDRKLEAIFRSRSRREGSMIRKTSHEILFWLTIGAIVAGYCYWRFY